MLVQNGFLDIEEKSYVNDFFYPDLHLVPYSLVCCGHFYAKEKYFTKRKNLPNYLLIITVGGCGEMLYKDKRCALKEGSAVIIDCNEYQEYNTYPNEQWDFYFAHFTSPFIGAYYDFLLRELTPVALSSTESAESLMQGLYQLSFEQDILSQIKSSNILSNILIEMVSSLTKQQESTKPRKEISKLITYIQNHFQEDLHIDDFIKLANISRHHLIRIFQNQTGTTPYKYLHICRIKQAQILLKTTDLSVNDIAYEVGYNDATVFIRHFRSITNITPLCYRRMD